MIRFPFADVASCLPHAGNMVLLDEIIHCDRDGLEARALVREDHIFLQEDRTLPVWLAVEIMAQGIAAYDGCHALNEGRRTSLGFLLGSRRLMMHLDSVPVGSLLGVRVSPSTDDGQGFGVFDCRLEWLDAPAAIAATLPEGRVIAEGALNVYQPREGSGESVSHVV
ncbi:MAG: thioester dehydrase [Lautropia sp.]|nr:thioester dehydrase [Lautropia sp.]